MRRATTAALLAAAFALPAAHAGAAPATRAACQEDMPCWTWSTMGDHRRGVATLDGARRVVVGPCRFARLAHGGYVDWQHTPHLRGDWTARRIGCRTYRPIAPASIY